MVRIQSECWKNQKNSEHGPFPRNDNYEKCVHVKLYKWKCQVQKGLELLRFFYS